MLIKLRGWLQQIHQHLVLPSAATYMTGLTILAKTKMQIGKVALQPDFVTLNKISIQYQLIDRIPKLEF